MVPAPAEPVYQGEDQTVQAGVNVPQVSNVAPEQVTEAFDEPLSMAIVNDIAELFIVK